MTALELLRATSAHVETYGWLSERKRLSLGLFEPSTLGRVRAYAIGAAPAPPTEPNEDFVQQTYAMLHRVERFEDMDERFMSVLERAMNAPDLVPGSDEFGAIASFVPFAWCELERRAFAPYRDAEYPPCNEHGKDELVDARIVSRRPIVGRQGIAHTYGLLHEGKRYAGACTVKRDSPYATVLVKCGEQRFDAYAQCNTTFMRRMKFRKERG